MTDVIRDGTFYEKNEFVGLNQRNKVKTRKITKRNSIKKKTIEDFNQLIKKYLQPSYFKASKQLLKSISFFIISYFMLYYFPWYLLPVAWLLLGTATVGLITVAKDCNQHRFTKNKVVDFLIGNLCTVPILFPYQTWREQDKGISNTTTYLANTRFFWWTTSIYQWFSSNVFVTNKKQEYSFSLISKYVFSALCVYIFAALYFSIMYLNFGVWSIFKYYIIPLIIFHFWYSTCITTDKNNVKVMSQSFTSYCSYPLFFEYLSNNLNYAYTTITTQFDEYNVLNNNNNDDSDDDDKEIKNKGDKEDTKEYIKFSNLQIPSYNYRELYKTMKLKFNKLGNINSSKLYSNGEEEEEEGTLHEEVSFLYPTFKSKTLDNFYKFLESINWPTTIFLLITPFIGLYGLFTLEIYYKTLILAVIWYSYAGLGITAGYHRLFSHKSYEANFFYKLFIVIGGTTAFQSSVFDWCLDHRSHHRYTDTDRDPYNFQRGFFYAHIGWLMLKKRQKIYSRADISDLEKDKLLVLQHKYYTVSAIFLGFIVPTLIAGLFWGDYAGGFFIAGVLSRVCILQSTFFINSLAHWVGENTFADTNSPKDNFLISLLTFGEGYHNFHHEFPYDYRNGVAWYSYDPTKWLIFLSSKLGFTGSLKFVSEDIYEKGKIIMKQKKLNKQKELLNWGADIDELPLVTKEQLKQNEITVGISVPSNLQSNNQILLPSFDKNFVDKLTVISTDDSDHNNSNNNNNNNNPSFEDHDDDDDDDQLSTPVNKLLNYVIVNGIVYDITPFLDKHPGGRGILQAYLGKDITNVFNGLIYNHSIAARNMLSKFRVAKLDSSSSSSEH
eukprot:TRINITY_DN1655_c8_g1_i1.p1 TRINITY_DN1655_c8_g1~~TRINITY_DN1655_c8_g1_i1.p1  ORF type:complete len:835 (-),score=235.58 TRINITY_DN1655_c8_g1_i1:253-2757(-)